MGETGTGKELARGPSTAQGAERPAANEDQLCDFACNLIEANYLAMKRGAFTEPTRESQGDLKLLTGATLFLTKSASCRWICRLKMLRVCRMANSSEYGVPYH